MSGAVFVKIVMVSFAFSTVLGYENVYDLIERRNQRRYYEPNLRHYQSTETLFDDRFHNRNPVRPYFGNGYDNLGNGLPVNRYHPFGHDTLEYRRDWTIDHRPYHRRTYDTSFRFGGEPYTRNYHRYEEYPNYFRIPYPKYEETSSRYNKHRENGYENRGGFDRSQIDRFLEDNEDKKHKKTDELYQRSQEGLNVDNIRREKTGERTQEDVAGENKSSLRTNKVVKKGHTTKGFASHHHKDETGNTTMFFDESSDFGGQTDFKDVADGFGTRRTLEHVTNKGDETYYNENGGVVGNYGSGYVKGNQKFEKDFTTSDHHIDLGENYYKGKENENVGHKKLYRYLNGDKFEFQEPHIDTYY